MGLDSWQHFHVNSGFKQTLHKGDRFGMQISFAVTVVVLTSIKPCCPSTGKHNLVLSGGQMLLTRSKHQQHDLTYGSFNFHIEPTLQKQVLDLTLVCKRTVAGG